MSAFTVTSMALVSHGHTKSAIVECTGPTSYDTGGSLIDFSSAVAAMGQGAFSKVFGVALVGVGASAVKQSAVAVKGASNSPSAWKVMLFDASVADGGDEVANTTNVSANTYVFRVEGT